MSTLIEVPPVKHKREVLDQAVIRFAGDSGDGMQITGNQFTNTAALYGNDIATFPDYPAEIRAPAGTIPGVSGFQLHFSSNEVYTPGDAIDVLIAMNPAALKVNVADLKANGILIVNSDSFKENDLRKAQMTSNPLEDHSLDKFRLFSVELERLTRRSLEHLGLDAKSMDRCKNFFALGMCYWLYNRSMEPTVRWIEDKFKNKPLLVEANKLTLKGGYSYCEATEAFQISYEIPPAQLTPGLYRSMSGNQALALGFVTAAQKSGLTLFQGSYPITPASDILHELSQYKDFGVMTFQAEDEIAAITSAIGAAYAGALAITTTSGPGMALKTEALGLAVAVEIPLVICDIQRGGPSTGLPTKTEQADLLQALFGRNSEAPIPVLAASTPADCFWVAIEACRIAVKYMVPVIILSDGYLANGAEPWRIPKLSDIPEIPVKFATDPIGFLPYKRDPHTLARPWAVPGTPGLEHRIGGLEKQDPTGNINYEPLNHENMVRIRAAKVAAVVQDIPNVLPAGDPEGDLLIVAWGSTCGSITAALKAQRAKGRRIGHLHLRHLNPLPSNVGDILKRYKRVLVPELNMGQLLWVLRAKFLVDAVGLNKIQGRPFKQAELEQKIEEMLGL
ncbi:MAG: 2-oxoglutarate ferredoxin oxidoreductase subunit alpha [Acidobacteria bacterium]|nr:MAG: 2-oxoglutarate ferredoxin oxidoreductase subunit alpha [Acidobacteriota bacterium]PYU50289.1 MAG: 2-oxoglutarate ferredoxin oxidoreductase subunit alpha [Acidobacteriota bacterium]PYU72712.1 MAG: 2-oxoglutarate ferredoxin oxidoreductase subunit alpha [Acidobacteriota bacterium]